MAGVGGGSMADDERGVEPALGLDELRLVFQQLLNVSSPVKTARRCDKGSCAARCGALRSAPGPRCREKRLQP